MSKLHKEVVQMSMAPTPATSSMLYWSVSIASWGVLYNQLTEEEKTWACLIYMYIKMVLLDMHATLKSRLFHHYNLFVGHP